MMDLLISYLKLNINLALQEKNHLNDLAYQLQKVCKTGLF